jgi:hypothetical protein
VSDALNRLYAARAEINAAIAALEGRIVAPAVKATRAGVRRTRAARRTDVELEAIRVDYIGDMPTAAIVAKHRISLNSLYTTAHQQGWKRPPRQRRPMIKEPVAAPTPPKAQAPAAELHPAEAHARQSLNAGGYQIEHLGEARWKLNGVEVNRVLFVTMGYHVRTKTPLPQEWLAKAGGAR